MSNIEATKVCPFCGESINVNAKKCKHCKEWLDANCHTMKNSINIPIEYWANENEKNYYIIMLVVSILIYLIVTICTFGVAIVYVLFFSLFIFISQAMSVAYLKQNSIKVTEEQFIDINEKVKHFASKLNLSNMPSVYISQSNGVLNALAKNFLRENIIIINADILELAYEEGEDAVSFIIVHELAHIQRKHLEKTKFLYGAYVIPFLPLAYSRACELTCDKIAYFLSNYSINGLLLLAGGKKLYKKVNVASLLKTMSDESGFWSWWTEVISTHPHISTRIKQLISE